VLEAVKVLPGRGETTIEKDAPPCLSFLTKKAPYKGLGADSEEKHEPVSDIDTVAVDSLKALDPNGPIREADVTAQGDKVKPSAPRARCRVRPAGSAATNAVVNIL
jgi:hypothetical protein